MLAQSTKGYAAHPTKNSQEYPPPPLAEGKYRATFTYSDKICTYFK